MQRGVVISSCQLQAGMWYIAVADLFQQSPSPPPVQFHITVSMESSALINHKSHESSVCCSLTKYCIAPPPPLSTPAASRHSP
jgi:hypothetical protein